VTDPGFWVLAVFALIALVFVAIAFPKTLRYHRTWMKWHRVFLRIAPQIEQWAQAVAALGVAAKSAARNLDAVADALNAPEGDDEPLTKEPSL
jgi:hypothetical protein